MRELKERFEKVWKRIGGKGNPTSPFLDLVICYNESTRRYHNLGHIRAMLAEFDEFRSCEDALVIGSAALDAVEIAIWYHDAIYSTHSMINEERSADLWRSAGGKAGIAQAFINNVVGMILATKHMSPTGEAGSGILCDIDLAILGASPVKFRDYEQRIRKEFSWVSDAVFRRERRAILEMFLGRKRIYTTDFFRDKYEAQAIKNLKRSIRNLSAAPVKDANEIPVSV